MRSAPDMFSPVRIVFLAVNRWRLDFLRGLAFKVCLCFAQEFALVVLVALLVVLFLVLGLALEPFCRLERLGGGS